MDDEIVIQKLANKIRYYINIERNQYQLSRDLKKWNQLCSALDTIEDTDLAIESFQSCEWSAETGMKYLLVYGILQALFIQQDAFKYLAECLETNCELNDCLQKVRDLRNRAIGHPVKKNSKRSQTSYVIGRYSMEKEKGFTLFNWNATGDTSEEIDLIQLIKSQKNSITSLLSNIVKGVRG